jgi:hypothetical protein
LDRSGVTSANFKQDCGNNSREVLSSPVVADYPIAQHDRNIQDERFGLTRNPFASKLVRAAVPEASAERAQLAHIRPPATLPRWR